MVQNKRMYKNWFCTNSSYLSFENITYAEKFAVNSVN